jgi:hypothetical protein
VHPMTPDQAAAYARKVILAHTYDIGILTIHEMAAEHTDAGTISDADAERVFGLISTAVVTVVFPSAPEGDQT